MPRVLLVTNVLIADGDIRIHHFKVVTCVVVVLLGIKHADEGIDIKSSYDGVQATDTFRLYVDVVSC